MIWHCSHSYADFALFRATNTMISLHTHST